MFLIPIGTDTKFRKFPIITLCLIIVMTLIFAVTYNKSKKIENEMFIIRKQIRKMIYMDLFKKDPTFIALSYNEQQEILKDKLISALDGKYQFEDDQKQKKYQELYVDYIEFKKEDFVGKYAFDPKHPSIITAITSAFLHGGILHLFGNMWFLFLFGAFVEDFFGKAYYSIFFLLAAIGAAYIHGMSSVPVIGASGAIAGLMSGFLVFFFTIRIKFFFFILIFFRPYVKTFFLKAYFALPMWFGMELIQHLMRSNDNIAHSGHIGGFLTGLILTLIIRFTPLNEVFKDKYFKSAAVENPKSYIDDIEDMILQNDLKGALDIARKALLFKPDHIPFLEEKLKIYGIMKDKESLISVYKKYFKILKEKDTDFSTQFISAFNECEYDIIDTNDFPSVLSNFVNYGQYEAAEQFSSDFLSRIKNKKLPVYSLTLIPCILAKIKLEKYDEALIKINEGLILNRNVQSELTKFRELRNEVLKKKFPQLSINIIDKLSRLEKYRLHKNKRDFLILFQELEKVKDITYTFEQYLYYTELLDQKKDYKKIVAYYQKMVSIYEEHPLKYIIYYRLAKLVYNITSDKTKALKYYQKATQICRNNNHLETIRNEMLNL